MGQLLVGGNDCSECIRVEPAPWGVFRRKAKPNPMPAAAAMVPVINKALIGDLAGFLTGGVSGFLSCSDWAWVGILKVVTKF